MTEIFYSNLITPCPNDGQNFPWNLAITKEPFKSYFESFKDVKTNLISTDIINVDRDRIRMIVVLGDEDLNVNSLLVVKNNKKYYYELADYQGLKGGNSASGDGTNDTSENVTLIFQLNYWLTYFYQNEANKTKLENMYFYYTHRPIRLADFTSNNMLFKPDNINIQSTINTTIYKIDHDLYKAGTPSYTTSVITGGTISNIAISPFTGFYAIVGIPFDDSKQYQNNDGAVFIVPIVKSWFSALGVSDVIAIFQSLNSTISVIYSPFILDFPASTTQPAYGASWRIITKNEIFPTMSDSIWNIIAWYSFSTSPTVKYLIGANLGPWSQTRFDKVAKIKYPIVSPTTTINIKNDLILALRNYIGPFNIFPDEVQISRKLTQNDWFLSLYYYGSVDFVIADSKNSLNWNELDYSLKNFFTSTELLFPATDTSQFFVNWKMIITSDNSNFQMPLTEKFGLTTNDYISNERIYERQKAIANSQMTVGAIVGSISGGLAMAASLLIPSPASVMAAGSTIASQTSSFLNLKFNREKLQLSHELAKVKNNPSMSTYPKNYGGIQIYLNTVSDNENKRLNEYLFTKGIRANFVGLFRTNKGYGKLYNPMTIGDTDYNKNVINKLSENNIPKYVIDWLYVKLISGIILWDDISTSGYSNFENWEWL